jgi:hypothetical protein
MELISFNLHHARLRLTDPVREQGDEHGMSQCLRLLVYVKLARIRNVSGGFSSVIVICSGNPGEEIKAFAPEPKVQWISIKDGTRSAPDLEDRAAKYLPQQNILMINGDFRVFTDTVDRWLNKYAQASGTKSVIESVVREWFEQQLVETVMGSLALRGSSQWTVQDLDKLWSEEALTGAVLPRYHVDINIKRTLGSRIGSLKEQVA